MELWDWRWDWVGKWFVMIGKHQRHHNQHDTEVGTCFCLYLKNSQNHIIFGSVSWSLMSWDILYTPECRSVWDLPLISYSPASCVPWLTSLPTLVLFPPHSHAHPSGFIPWSWLSLPVPLQSPASPQCILITCVPYVVVGFFVIYLVEWWCCRDQLTAHCRWTPHPTSSPQSCVGVSSHAYHPGHLLETESGVWKKYSNITEKILWKQKKTDLTLHFNFLFSRECSLVCKEREVLCLTQESSRWCQDTPFRFKIAWLPVSTFSCFKKDSVSCAPQLCSTMFSLLSLSLWHFSPTPFPAQPGSEKGALAEGPGAIFYL